MADLSATLVPSVTPDKTAPDDRQNINATPESFGAAVARGTEKLGAGAEQASSNLFQISAFQDKIAADYGTNNFTDARNRVLYGDPSKLQLGADGSPVTGPDGKPMPDTGYLGLTGSAAAYAREDILQKLKDLREQERTNLKSPQAQLEFDIQTRRLYSDAEQRIGSHAETQYKGWAGTVADASAQHSLNDFSNNLDNSQLMQDHAKDYVHYKVVGAQLKSGGDPVVMAQAADDAQRDLLRTRLAAIEVRDPVGAMKVLDAHREIAGVEYPQLAERIKGKVDQQDGISIADGKIAATTAQPYASRSHPTYAAAAAANPGGMSAAGLARTVQMESSGNPESGKGTAHVGLGSFDVPTAAEAGVANRLDPEQSIRGIAKLSASRAPVLQTALGRAPTDAELYLAHQQGAGGASKLLSNPNARAGDLVGDDHIRDNGGDPNAPASAFTSLWKQKFDNASFASGEMGSGAALAHREGMIKSDILADPDLTARPQAQNAALARVGNVFAAQRLQLAQDDAAFKLKVQNTTAEAIQTGSVQNPLPKEQFVSTYGATDGEKAYAEYQANVQLGGDLHATAGVSPEQLHGLMDKYTPRPGAEDYLDQVRRADTLAKAISQNRAERDKDPAAFVVARTQSGQEAWQQFQQLTSDPKASAGMKTAYAQMFASKLLAEQERIGVAPQARTLLPEWYATPIRDKIAATATATDPKDRAGTIPMITAQKELWGSYWGDVAPQISPPNAAPLVKAIAAGMEPAAAQRILEIPKGESPTKILKEQNEVTAKNLSSSLNLAFQPLLSSMVGIQKERDYSGLLNLGTELAALYVRDGRSEKDAAQNAFDDIIGKRYTFADTYRIPKGPGIDAAAVQRGVYEATQEIQRGSNGGNLLEQARAQYPVLKNQDYGYVENFRPGAGGLEHWEPGDKGTDEAASDGQFNVPRPNGLPLDKPGLEIRDPTTQPMGVLADIVSHGMRKTDPVVKAAYEKLQASMTPHQLDILKDQYEYSKENEGEKGSFDDWKERSGMPAFFRGYTFQQWPKEFNDKAYTPEQRADLDGLMSYLGRGGKPMRDPNNLFNNLNLGINGLGVTDQESDFRHGIARDGRFVTSPKADGLNIMKGNDFVRDTKLNPVLLTWDQLQNLGIASRASGSARVSTEPSEQFP
jgi:hypothetical protein